MRRFIALAGLFAMACSGASSSNGGQVQSTSTAAATGSPSGATLAPPSPVTAPLACRLPIMVSAPAGEAPGGWISFPGGTFQTDPASQIDRPYWSEGISYDRAVNRWINADWNHISSDGQRFVVLADGPTIAIITVATGAKRVITMPPAYGSWVVIDWIGSGIYMNLIAGLDRADPGLWQVNPDSGQVRKLDATQFWSQVDAKAAWGTAVVGDTIVLRRLDLQSGVVTDQFTVPSHRPVQPGDRSLELISLDGQGRPLLLERDWQKLYPWHLGLLTAPNTLTEVSIPSEWQAGWPMWDNGDPYQTGRELHGLLLSSGIWMFGTNSFPGVARLGPDGRVAQLTDTPSNISAFGGGCH